jgi:hypothetical protein
VTQLPWPSKTLRQVPFSISQSRSVLSQLPDKARVPLASSETERTESECPSRFQRHWPVSASQTRTVLSQLAETQDSPVRR